MQVRLHNCNLLLWQVTCAWCYQAFWHVFAAAALCVVHCFADITHARCSDGSFSSEHSAPLSAACHYASQQAEVLQRHLPRGVCSACPFWPAQRCPAAWVLYMSAIPLFFTYVLVPVWRDTNTGASMFNSANSRQWAVLYALYRYRYICTLTIEQIAACLYTSAAHWWPWPTLT